MKPSPQYDFFIYVRRQTWEEEPSVSSYYEGIFDVDVNHSFNVMFIPALERRVWPPMLPENTDEVKSAEEARLVCTALSRYVVTSHEAMSGREESFPRDCADSRLGLLFYVSEAEFSTLSSELSTLAEQRPSVHSGWKMSEIADLAVSKFLLSRVLASKNMAQEDLEMLMRKKA